MLSAQCDELREMADQLQEHGTFVGFGGLTNTDPLMLKSATLMREAADTIWELRDMVHKERTEANRLREERDHWHVEQVHAYGNWEDAHKRAIELEKQNAKLRELVSIAWKCIHSGLSCSDCRLVAGGCTLQSAMRELEVDA